MPDGERATSPLIHHHHNMLLIILLLHACRVSAQYAMAPFGGGCGGGCSACRPCAPCVPPPPPPCPAQYCPPPPVCPPPPPPPMCPAPQPSCPCAASRPVFYQQQYTAYRPTYGGGCGAAALPRAPAQNDCCCGCSSPCRYKSRRFAAFGAKTVDPSCNNNVLREIIMLFIGEDASESKRKIQVAAEEKLGGMVNVICGRGEFSYVAHTDTFCQATNGEVTCYAFRPLV